MKYLRIAALAAVLAAGVLLAGCTSPAEAEMSESPDVWGYVASADKAQLELAEDQVGADELVVERVLVPGASWIVVHADDNGKPGMRVGLKRVERGESTDVKVELEDLTTGKVIVAVHADRGTAEKFDFDMMAKEMSPDRPYFVAEKELAKVATVREFGVKAEDGEASIDVADQPGAAGTLAVARAVAPTDAWIVVHLDDDGAPGARVGLLHIPAGETADASVKLDPVPLGAGVLVAVHADRGEADLFEFDMMDKLNSPDQPFFVEGAEVATAVKVK